MSLFEVDEADQLKNVEEGLIRKFSDRVPAQRVSQEFGAAVMRFAKAPVRAFVPVLIQREVSESLRRSGTTASAT